MSHFVFVACSYLKSHTGCKRVYGIEREREKERERDRDRERGRESQTESVGEREKK